MPGLMATMETGRQALMARQQQLAVTGQNLANADRVGYRRREATVVSSPGIQTPQGEIGTGVQVVTIVRAFDQALEMRLHAAARDMEYQDSLLTELQGLEAAIAPGGESALSAAFERFTADLQRLSASPHVPEYRESFLATARDLASQVRRDDRQMGQQQGGILNGNSGRLADSISTTNDLAARIAELNNRIARAERASSKLQPANDLRDERDELLASLSREVNLELTIESDGSYSLAVGSQALVSGSSARELVLDTSTGQPLVNWRDSGDLAGVDSGRLGGLLYSWDYLADRQTELDAFAATLVSTVNGALISGYDATGAPGVALFSGADAAGLSVTLSQARKLGLSASAQSSGDGSQAVALLAALETPVPALGETSLRAFPSTHITNVARDVAAAEQGRHTAAATHVMYEQAVSAASGVSLDEEMINMLQLQRAYQASARFMSVLDDMLQQALSII